MGYLKFVIYFLFLYVFSANRVLSQNTDSISAKNRNLKKGIVIGSTGLYTLSSLSYLNFIWYKPYATSVFHFYNDNNEWCQMDKLGHVFTTYNSGRLIAQALRWSGFASKKSILIGEVYGTLYMTTIEVMDGFSKGWGFSWGDEAANVSGGMLFTAQQYFWNEQRIQFKFSFHQTTYPQYRPNELGANFTEQLIKDYNGQSYWLSVNAASFLKKGTKFPKWINLAFGYGAEGMISGMDNYYITTATGTVIGQNRYRKLFLSLDIDFTKIKTKSGFLKTLFSVMNGIKVPFPALEFNNRGVMAHPFYF
jgi:hypothetical protein